jgi:hypothetical protein
MKHNKLTAINSAKLYQFLDNDKDSTRSKTAKALAEEASVLLGCVVTPPHVDHLRRCMGLNPQRATATKIGNSEPIRLLAREIIALKNSLGSRPCAELVALAEG